MYRSLLTIAAVASLAVATVAGVAVAQTGGQAKKAMAEKEMMAKEKMMAKKESMAAKGGSRAFLNGYNLPASGVALEGYCPVCYLAAGKAAKGSPEFAADYNGVTYYFVSEPVKQTFLANPEKYLPAYGGWCAIGIANGKNFPVDPTNFKVVDGRVLLFLRNKNVDALALWNKGNDNQQLSAADAAWAKRG